MFIAGWSSLAARRAHNPKVVGSNPTPATNNNGNAIVLGPCAPFLWNKMRKIHDLIEPTIQALGLELWSCELHQNNHRALLRVYIDRTTGVTVDDCTRVSR